MVPLPVTFGEKALGPLQGNKSLMDFVAFSRKKRCIMRKEPKYDVSALTLGGNEGIMNAEKPGIRRYM
jgi:hypothetical protein